MELNDGSVDACLLFFWLWEEDASFGNAERDSSEETFLVHWWTYSFYKKKNIYIYIYILLLTLEVLNAVKLHHVLGF